jgi:23S rRNA (uracil1939-C5)-methyltransferase
VWLAPFALPGELVKLEPANAKPTLVRARVAGVVEAAPERVDPKCRHFARCGGCHYQHAADSSQAAMKVAILRDVLERVGKLRPPDRIGVVEGPAWGYRNRVQVHFDGPRMGFHEAGSNRVVEVDQCPVASPRLNQAMSALASMARERAWPDFVRSIELFTDEERVQLNLLDSGVRHPNRGFFERCARHLPGAMEPTLDYAAAGHTFRVSHKSFFQVNRFLVDALVEEATAGLAGDAALDLYAGVGLFSLALARSFARVTAVEAVSSAVADLQFNAHRAGLAIEAVKAPVEQHLIGLDSIPPVVVCDPPRAGLDKAVVRELARLRPAHLVLVSCDPPTLARDLRGLLDSGYGIERATLIDLFPQTAHIETVVRLAAA